MVPMSFAIAAITPRVMGGTTSDGTEGFKGVGGTTGVACADPAPTSSPDQQNFNVSKGKFEVYVTI